MKYYRQAYMDLVQENDLPQFIKDKYILFIIRFFDRVELAFIKEWTYEHRDILLEQLQNANRTITYEKNKYLSIFDSLPTPIIILDKENMIDNLNYAAVELLLGNAIPGADYYAENKTKHIIEIFPCISKEFQVFIAGESNIVKYEKEINFDGKGPKIIEIVFKRMFDVSGQFNGTIITLIDITKRKQMEYAIRRLDRLNLVGEMAASLGHEIRNPMTTVRGFLQLFMDDYVKEREAFALMIEELDRANAIITEFLSLAWNRVVELKLININSIINKIMPLVNAYAMAEEKSVAIKISDIPDLLLDEKEIRQLILNLVRNGLEAMSSGGKVTIKTYMENGSVILAVSDEGHGIKPEILEKLGTPFLTTKEGGTGLGLAICYGIAMRHNANIHVETGENGTTFFVVFPRVTTETSK